jgi:hypothetical protein
MDIFWANLLQVNFKVVLHLEDDEKIFLLEYVLKNYHGFNASWQQPMHWLSLKLSPIVEQVFYPC